MTDREYLELAGLAAGETYTKEHNPLERDDLALRLAVKLRLEPRFIDNSHSNGAEPSRVTMHNIAGMVENIDGDPLAATRRAIVRAAAEIGRSMK